MTTIAAKHTHIPGFPPPAAAIWHLLHSASSASEVSPPVTMN